MRCFIGLDLQAPQKLALESWRKNALPGVSHRAESPRKGHASPQLKAQPVAVPTANFHITLCFLGHITPRQHEAVTEALDELNHGPFELTLDTTGLWQGPKVMFAAPTEPPQELMDLARSSRKAARKARIETDSRPYQPHVTVIRKATSTLPLPLFMPDIQCQFRQFHLFESVSGPKGVSYPIRHSWSLTEALTARERLRRGML